MTMTAEDFFPSISRVPYEGPDSAAPFGFRWYDPGRVVLGKAMRDQLLFAVCFWHTFGWAGTDMFGAETFTRPWLGEGDPLALAERKAAAAFELFEKLGV